MDRPDRQGHALNRPTGRAAEGASHPARHDPVTAVNHAMTARKILAFGEILWDLLPDGPVLGGAPFNFACRMGSLGHHALVASRLGRDDLGRRARGRIAELGMDARLIQSHDDKPTGTVPIKLGADGVPDFTILPDVAYDYIESEPALLEAAAAADCVCFGTLAQRTATSRETLYQVLDAAERSVKLADINLRRDCYSPETVRESLRRADILKLNEDEVRYVAALLALPPASYSEFAARLLTEAGLTHCVITLGPRGVFAASAEGEMAYEPGRDVAVKDTTGSGDGLTAAFVHALLNGANLRECCRLGNAMGSLVATRAGATHAVAPEALAAFLHDPPPAILEPSLRDYLPD